MICHSQQLGFALLSFLQLPLSTIFIAIMCAHHTLSTSNSTENLHRECSSLVSCGNISNVGYPFWGDHFRPPYCGHSAFKLECPRQGGSDHPILHIHGNQRSWPYKVVGINSSAMTITLQDFLPNNPSEDCLMPSSYLSDAVAEGLIEYSPGVDNITLSYDCNPNKVEALVRVKNFTCLDEDYYFGFGYGTYYYGNNEESKDELNRSCSQSIQVPVSGIDQLHMQRNLTLESVFKRGFEVTYARLFVNHCLPCQKSGGACAFSEGSGFVCHCNGWESSDDCQKSGRQRQYAQPDAHKVRRSNSLKRILYIAIPGASFLIITSIIAALICLKKSNLCSQTLQSRRTSYNRMRSDLEFGNGIHVFSYTELQEATNNFDPSRELGDGGFGVVYYGKLRDGREVAVKHLFDTNYNRAEQFRNEVVILTQLSHPNLVTLYGCTSRRSQKLLLVYEYIPNGTVADHLYGEQSNSGSLTWTLRMKIAIETAEALSYLHATGIIHRDVKTNNILLDNYFCVKVADFGLSRFFPFDATHVSTVPHGTPGYLDPEYEKFYQVTSKSDVYSFGVVLLELISSLPAIDVSRDGDEIKLSTYAVNKIKRGELSELVDEKLGMESDSKVKRTVTLVAELALQCLQEEKDIRPCMNKVLQALKQIESLDYGAVLEELEVETSVGIETSKPVSDAAETQVDQPFRNALMMCPRSSLNYNELRQLTQMDNSYSFSRFKRSARRSI